MKISKHKMGQRYERSISRKRKGTKERGINEGMNTYLYILQTLFCVTSKKYSNSSRQNKNCRSRVKVHEHCFSSIANNKTA